MSTCLYYSQTRCGKAMFQFGHKLLHDELSISLCLSDWWSKFGGLNLVVWIWRSEFGGLNLVVWISINEVALRGSFLVSICNEKLRLGFVAIELALAGVLLAPVRCLYSVRNGAPRTLPCQVFLANLWRTQNSTSFTHDTSQLWHLQTIQYKFGILVYWLGDWSCHSFRTWLRVKSFDWHDFRSS